MNPEDKEPVRETSLGQSGEEGMYLAVMEERKADREPVRGPTLVRVVRGHILKSLMEERQRQRASKRDQPWSE